MYMESTLHDVLRNLCHKYGWSYGAFWCYDEENPLLLTLKDVYLGHETSVLADAMIGRVHVMGDGIVGQVAFSGTHSWLFSDSHLLALEQDLFDLVGNQDVFQVPSDVQCQFFIGIKTIAVIPVEPRGVVQFGSYEKITENERFLDETKRFFSEVETVDESITQQDDSLKIDLLDQLLSTTWNHQPSLFEVQSPQNGACPPISQSDQQCSSSMLPSMQTVSQYIAEPDTDGNLQRSSSMDALETEDFEILTNLLIDHENISLDRVLGHSFSSVDNATDHPQGSKTSNFQEYHDFLDQNFRDGQMMESQAASYGLGSKIAPSISDGNIAQRPVASHWSDLSRQSDAGDSTSLYKSIMCRTRKMPDYSSPLFNGLSSQRLKYDAAMNTRGCSWMRRATPNCSSKYETVTASKTGVARVAKPFKKKAKPGEARHRPKDRELQQKFYAQLKSIVPDGQKCTQDGLLESTIRHITFLQNVARHADILKHGYCPELLGLVKEVIRADSSGETRPPESTETLDDNPIIVEVLSSPGSYVIEMICDGRLPFLEIVDRMRGYGLNIMNGVMDSGENKMSVYFIVETVMRHISKADIYGFFTQLLEELDAERVESHQSSQGHAQASNPHLSHSDYPTWNANFSPELVTMF